MAKNKPAQKTNLEPVEEIFDEEETTDDDDSVMEENSTMATATKKATERANKDAAADDAADEDEVEETSTVDPNAFAPYIIHENQEWDLAGDEGILNDVDNGQTVILYDLDNERWYKLMPIKVGEVST